MQRDILLLAGCIPKLLYLQRACKKLLSGCLYSKFGNNLTFQLSSGVMDNLKIRLIKKSITLGLFKAFKN